MGRAFLLFLGRARGLLDQLLQLLLVDLLLARLQVDLRERLALGTLLGWARIDRRRGSPLGGLESVAVSFRFGLGRRFALLGHVALLQVDVLEDFGRDGFVLQALKGLGHLQASLPVVAGQPV